MRIYLICLLGLLMLSLIGCSNPYLAPDTSKALSEKSQLTESEKQTELMERQTKALEQIADKMK